MKKLTVKKLLSLFLVLCLGLATLSCLVACDEEDAVEESSVPLDIDIMTMPTQLAAYNQTNDIRLHPDNYEGKVIRIKGTFSRSKLEDGTQKHNFIDVSDGCNCGTPPAWVSFVYDGDLPATNTEVIAIGTIRTAKENGYKYPELVVEKIKF